MKTFMLVFFLALWPSSTFTSCGDDAPAPVETVRSNFITEWETVTPYLVLVTPVYDLFPEKVNADALWFEFYEAGNIVKTEQRRFGEKSYLFSYDDPSRIQIVYAYVLRERR